jgi:hypothetical protein
MPMAMRKGIEAKKVEREKERRREAREGGIVLERAGGGSVGGRGKGKRSRRGGGRKEREREIGAPGVGVMKGGTLVLGKGDVEKIEGRARSGGSGV